VAAGDEAGPLVDRGDPSRSSEPPEVPLRVQSATATITRAVTVAGGVFAPGHLGELTQYLPFELVDNVLATAARINWPQTRRQAKVMNRRAARLLPRPFGGALAGERTPGAPPGSRRARAISRGGGGPVLGDGGRQLRRGPARRQHSKGSAQRSPCWRRRQRSSSRPMSPGPDWVPARRPLAVRRLLPRPLSLAGARPVMRR
jgi:hypothetical protein